MSGGGAVTPATITGAAPAANTGGGMTYLGTGTTTLSGSNTYTGGTLVNNGTVQANGNNVFSTGTLTVDKLLGQTTKVLFNGVTITNAITIAGANPGTGLGVLQAVDTTSPTLSGPININSNSSAGGHFMGPTTSGLLTVSGPVTLGGVANTLSVNNGYVRFSGGGSYTNMTIRQGSTSLGANNALATAAIVDIGGNGAAILDLNGFNQTLAGVRNAVGPANMAWVTNSVSATQSTLTLAVSNVQVFNGSIVGNLAVNVTGGTQVYSNSATAGNGIFSYTGATTISGGTLAIAGAAQLGGGSYSWPITNNGIFNYASSAAQTLSGVISGTGILTNSGTGTLTLSGNNTYTGGTAISAGELLGPVGASCSNSVVTVLAGGTNGVLVAATNGQWVCGGLTYGSGTACADFEMGANAWSTNTAPLLVNGNVAFNGTLNIIVRSTWFVIPGVYPLITFTGTRSGTPPTTAFALPNGVAGTITTNANTLFLNVTGGSYQDVWTGAANTNWDIAASVNWKTNGTAATYADGDNVLFDDSSSVNTINIAATVSPSSITVSNSVQNYTFTNGIIAGGGALTKNGTAILSLTNANTYTGGTVLNGGTLALGGASPVGVGGVFTNNNGSTVQFNAPTIANNIVVPAGATVSWVNVVSGTTLSGNLSGGGTINESGNIGGFTLTGNNSGFTGVMNGASSGANQRWRFNSYTAGSAAAAWTLNNTDTDGYGFAAGGSGTIFFGSLSGSGYFRNDAAGTVTLSVGALNTDTTFSGTIVANTTSILALTKTGTGTFTLTGTANNYNGLTTISGGRLAITPANLAGAGPMSINDNGRLSLTMLGSVPQMSLSTLTLGSVNGCTNEFALVSSTTTAPVFATTLTLAGTNVINIISGGFASGSIYPLIGYTTINGAGGFKIGTVPAGVVATITTNNISGVNTIALNVSTANTTVDVWGGRTSGNWDTSTSGNWTNSGAAVIYADNDNVQFDDTASNFTVTAVSAGNPYLSPGNIVFSNTANAYTLGGSPVAINSLTKSGAGSLTITTAEKGMGNTVINGGTINLNGSDFGVMLGIGGTITFNGGTIASTIATANTTVIQNNISVPGGITGTINMSTRTVLGSASSTYSLTGAGTLNLNANTSASRDDIEMKFSDFTGAINFTGTGGVRLFYQNGAFNGFGTAAVDIEGSVGLQPQTFSTGTTWNVGALSGSSSAASLANSSAGAVTYSIGANNASTAFAGQIQGNSAITKVGSGIWTISGTNNYTGATTVSAGTLMAVAGSSCSNSPVTVNTGATNGVIINTAGAQWACSNLTYAAGTEYALFTFNTISPSTTTAPLLVQSNLTISGTLNVSVVGYTLPLGTYPLIKYGNTLAGAPVLTPLALPQRDLGYLTNDTANKQISLVITNVTSYSEPLVWQPGSGLWDTATASWKDQLGVTTSYSDFYDAVLFNETPAGSGPFTVTNSSSFSPLSVTVSNVTKAYTMSGLGGISGTASLTKLGAGTLTLVTSNSFTGGTTISAGTIQLGDGASNNGYVSGNITNNAVLAFAAPVAQTVTNPISGTGAVNSIGAGVLTLSGTNTFTGNLSVKAGKVSVSIPAALGAGTVVLGDTNGSAGASLLVAGSSNTFTNPVTVQSGTGGLLTIGNQSGANSSYVFSGNVALNNALNLLAVGTGTVKLSGNLTGSSLITVTNDGAAVSTSQYVDLTGANSGFTGNVAVNGGMLRLEGATALNSANTIQFNYANTMLNLNATASLTLAGLTGVAGGIVTNTSSGGRTLTLAGAGQYAFNGAIMDANTATTRISLTFTGTGTNIFGGTNTYSGATLVTNGTLLVNGWNLGTNTVTVTNAGTAFGGTGVISGPVTFYAGTFAQFTLGAPLGFSNSLTIAASGVRPQVEVALTNSTPPGTYVLATNASASGSFSNTPVIIGGSLARPNYTATILTTSTNVVLVVGTIPTITALTATPNPSVYGGSVVFTATVQTNSLTVTNAAGDATGGFIFRVDGSAAATNSLAGGVASFTSSTLTAGSHVIQAFYAGDANYSATSNSVTQTVSPRPVILAGTRAYNGTAVATNLILTITNYVGTDNLSLSNVLTGYAGLAGAGVGTNLITATNNLSLSGTGVATNYTLTGSSGSVVITVASLVITASNTNKVYGQALTLTGFTTAGLAAGDTVTSVSLTSSGAANTATVGSYGITAAGAAGSGLANYSISYVSGTLTVNPLVAVLAGTRAYDGTTNAPGANLTVTNAANSDTVTLGGTGGLASAFVGTNAITSFGSLSLSGGAGTNYTLTGATGFMIITNTPLTITANNASKTYDGTGYSGGNGVTYAGFVNGETNTALTGSLSYGGLAQGATNAGTYNITPGGYSSTNYLISYVDGTLTISPLAVTVTAYPQTKVYGSADPALTYTNSPALVAGDSFTGALSRVAGEAVGSYAINQGGLGSSANYSLTYVGTNLTITAAPLVITANSTSKVYGQNLVFAGTEFTAAGLTNGDTISSVVLTSSGATNTATVGSYDIVAVGAAGSSGLTNYTIGYSNGTLTVTQATPTNTLASSANPSGFHDTVTFTNTLNADATGYVLLSTNSVLWSSNNLSGGVAVSLSITNLPRGTNLITAAYSGDTNYVAGSITLNQIVTNHPPAANTATYSRGAFTTWQIVVSDLLTNASDVDGDTLTLVGVGASTNGITLVVNTNSPARVQYYNTNHVADQFTFTVADGYGGTNSAVVTLSATGGGVTGTSSITTITGTGVKVLTAYGIPGYTYVTQRATNLSQVTWLNLATNTLATNAVIISVTDSNPPSPSAYYRLLWSGH